MCTFSESSRVRLGNAVMYIAARAKYPYKTEVLFCMAAWSSVGGCF